MNIFGIISGSKKSGNTSIAVQKSYRGDSAGTAVGIAVVEHTAAVVRIVAASYK
jgi:hypothetical protein